MVLLLAFAVHFLLFSIMCLSGSHRIVNKNILSSNVPAGKSEQVRHQKPSHSTLAISGEAIEARHLELLCHVHPTPLVSLKSLCGHLSHARLREAAVCTSFTHCRQIQHALTCLMSLYGHLSHARFREAAVCTSFSHCRQIQHALICLMSLYGHLSHACFREAAVCTSFSHCRQIQHAMVCRACLLRESAQVKGQGISAPAMPCWWSCYHLELARPHHDSKMIITCHWWLPSPVGFLELLWDHGLSHFEIMVSNCCLWT